MFSPILKVVLGVAGALALVAIVTRKTIRYVGDKAGVDDEVVVPLGALTLPPGLVLPPGTGSIGLVVTAEDKDTVTGLASRLYTTNDGTATDVPVPLQTGLGPLQVRRAAIVAVYHNGTGVRL